MTVVKKVLGTYLIWLIFINLFSYYALNRFNLSVDTSYSWINPKEFYQDKSLNLIDLRVHWDSFWYIKIVNEGYQYIPGELSSIAFFPLYPSTIWVLSQIPMLSPALGGWIVSTVALGLALIFLYNLVKEFHPQIDPIQPIILLLIFPTAIFLNSVYTESLFLALSIISFYYMFKKKFLKAALFISLASICRINGLFLLTPFLYEYFKTYGIKKFFNQDVLSLPLSFIGILGLMVYQYVKFNEPVAFLKAQMQWGRTFSFNSEHLHLISPSSYANLATDLLFFIVCIVSGILMMKKIRFSYGLYVLVATLVATSTGTLMSISRFSLILFPIFIFIASIKSKEFQFGWQLVSILLLAVYTTFFVNNYWAG